MQCFPTNVTTRFNINHQIELANVSIFKATMDHMDLISPNSDEVSIHLSNPIILAAETSQKDNLHLGETMKADNCEDFMKAKEKINTRFDHRRCLGNTSKIITSNLCTHNPINMELQNKKKPI